METELSALIDSPLQPSLRAVLDEVGVDRFANRELSRLDFGQRLLELAADRALPVLDRVKFLAIFSELLDEFFQVRVAGLEDQEVAGVRTRSSDGLRPAEQLAAIRDRVLELIAYEEEVFSQHLAPALRESQVELVEYSELAGEDVAFLKAYFQRDVFPVLTPLAVDPGHPFPYISNLSINLIVEVRDPRSDELRYARVKVPPLLDRFVVLPDQSRVVRLEELIADNLPTLFPGVSLGEHAVFRLTRNTDLALEEDEADDLLVAIEAELRRRRFGRAVRLEVERNTPTRFREMLVRELDLDDDAVYEATIPLGLHNLWTIVNLDRPDLRSEKWVPRIPARLRVAEGEQPSIFRTLRERDLLVHHPYESFAASVESFIEQAADDPQVVGIKQTLYRTSGNSPIVAPLIRASEQGKQVAALVELKARFDELANIEWAKALEDAGVHVVYGIVGLKTHSKTSLVIRKEGQALRRYCHIGTGNYNSKTARTYEDLGLLTADDRIGTDVGSLFNFLTGYARDVDYREILVAPDSMRERLIALIDEQAELGAAGRIVLKLNGLTDPAIIDALYLAAMQGCCVELIVRGLCSIRAGRAPYSDGIRVRSIVGDFLEHSRVYQFGSPEAPGGLRCYLGSADLMERNLDRRVEVLTPIHEPKIQARLSHILELALQDDQHAWTLLEDQTWLRVKGEAKASLQQALMEEVRALPRG